MHHTILKQVPERPSWQQTLRDLVTDPIELCRLLELAPDMLQMPEAALRAFPLRVPLPYLSRIEKANRHDPLLLQVLPVMEETQDTPGYSNDPLDEVSQNPQAGILHKYHGRVLLMPTSSCAIHCRYCFRRHFPYSGNIPGREQWQDSLTYISNDSSITEVILSGGDPLMLSDSHLSWLLEKLEAIPHLQRLRFHTRLPIMIPARINDDFCSRLQQSRLLTTLVLHSNHANELDEEVAGSCQLLRASGITLLNQSVLLKNINDNTATLAALSERLFEMGVLPYYLHLPDKTQGTAHFDVDSRTAHELHDGLQHQLPGYLVPRLVREIPGKAAKTLL